jgi:2-(1,2-epoxy-1,2-dihydrophenyl)acetyl-CoA isomerase
VLLSLKTEENIFMEFETIVLEKENGLATLYLNRPDVLNAIDNKMRRELLSALEDIDSDSGVRALILTGKGTAFCAGGDVRGMGKSERMINPQPIIRKIANLEKPVIAAVNGTAAGAGCSLALAADIVIASTKAKFVLSFVKIGLVPDWGGLFFLPRRVGIAKAKELLFTASRISAEEAERIGLINGVMPESEFEQSVRKFAQQILRGAPIPIGMIKKILNVTQNSDIESVFNFEYQAQTICRGTDDHKEGIMAFKEKRDPRFLGK